MTEERVEALLRELGVDLGFCLPAEACEALVEKPPSNAEEFARAVFTAEGLDFDSYGRPEIRSAVVVKIDGYLAKQ
jgi:hypothetical protein